MSQALARPHGGSRLLLMIAAMMIVAMAGAAGLRSMASAQGGPDAICQAMGFDFGFKVGEDPTGTHTVTYEDADGVTQTAGSLTVDENDDETGIDWSSTFAVGAVLVKGGPGHNVYEYPEGSMGDTGLMTNVNPKNPNGFNYELSNVVFCYDGLENGGEDPQEIQYTVSIAKWVEGAAPAEGSFDFTATWTAANLNDGVETSGNFTLDASNSFMATTSPMDAGASYSVVENGIDMVCDEGDAYRLVGYSVGSTWEEAQAATPGDSAAIADLQSNQYVVVHNEGCGDVSPTGNGSITIVKEGLTDGVEAVFNHNVPGESSSFTLDWENNSITFSELPAGDYQFTELPIEGWTLLGFGCNLANARGIQSMDEATGNTLVAVLGEDMDLVCTFVNGQAQELQHTVTIHKYVDGAIATEGEFEFTATWTAANLNDGLEDSGTFTLNEVNNFMAVTAAMDAGADYSVVENNIDAVCDPGDDYRLLGYGIGETLEAAAAAEPVEAAAFTDLQASQHVVVQNEACAEAGQYTVTVTKYVEGALATEGAFEFTSTWTAANLNDGLEDSGTFTLDSGNGFTTTTALMDAGASYSVVENGIDAVCEPGDEYQLLGYGLGETLEAAAAAEPVEAAAFTDLQASQHVVVQNEACAEAGRYTVTVTKYVEGALATEGSFEFTSTWTAANLNDGLEDSGTFTLDSGNGFAATTALMDAGASYSVVENGIDAICEPGDEYQLLGYGLGETLEAAAAAEPVEAAAFTDLQADQYVVVHNEPCPVGTSSITIVKEGLTDGVEAVFVHDVPGDSDTFTLTAEDNSFTIEALEAGTYTFTELPIEGWRLVSAGCGFSSLSPDTVGDTLTVVLGEDEDQTCTFVNEMEPGSVTVEKFVDGQTAVEGSFQFTETTPAAESVVTLDSSNAYVYTTGDLPGGTAYMLSEDGIDAICEEGDDYRLAGYTMGATRDEALAGEPMTEVNIEALMGDVYVIVWNQDCDNLGSITIVKDFDPDASVEASFTAEGLGTEDFTILEGDENGMTFETLGIGDYTFTEEFLAGWRVQSIFCSGQQSPSSILINLGEGSVTVSLTAGDDITCTFTNIEDASTVPGALTIVKDWGEDEGVDTTFTVSENLGVDGNSITLMDSEGADSMAFEGIAPDTYTFVEDELEGWTLTGINCEGQDSPQSIEVDLTAGSLAVNLQPGETVVCTFTNAMDDETPVETGSITITKVVNPDVAATFSFTTTGEGLAAFDLVTGNPESPATATFAGLAPGTYTVTETDVNGWSVTNIVCEGAGEGSANGDVTTGTSTIELVAGADVECIYTNTQDELLALLDFVPFINNPGNTPVTNETPNVNVPNNPGTDTSTDNSTNVGSGLPDGTTGEVPSSNIPNPGIGGSTDPFLNPVQQGPGQGTTENPSSVLGERTPLAPSTGNALVSGSGSNLATTLAFAAAFLLGGSAIAIRAASRR